MIRVKLLTISRPQANSIMDIGKRFVEGGTNVVDMTSLKKLRFEFNKLSKFCIQSLSQSALYAHVVKG